MLSCEIQPHRDGPQSLDDLKPSSPVTVLTDSTQIAGSVMWIQPDGVVVEAGGEQYFAALP